MLRVSYNTRGKTSSGCKDEQVRGMDFREACAPGRIDKAVVVELN